MDVDTDKLLAELERRKDWWRKNQEDPYNISNAVIVALNEFAEAIKAAAKKTDG